MFVAQSFSHVISIPVLESVIEYIDSDCSNCVVRSFGTVTASMVKQLRDLTGAPMMDCKKALQHEGVDGNLEKAVEVLRKQGMKRVNKVSSRTTTQGVIASVVTEKKGVMVEVLF